MGKKAACNSTEYTNGFQITRQPDGMFVATKGKAKLQAKSAAELNELIKNFHQSKE